MTKIITTTELLDFLAKAHKVSSDVCVKKEDEGYEISVYCDWYNLNDFEYQTTFISDKGQYTYKVRYNDFYTMKGNLDYLVEEQEEREMKERKRQELVSRLTDGLTDDEIKLLGLK